MIRAEREVLEWLDARKFGFRTAYELLPSRAAEADRVLNGGFEDWTGGSADNWTGSGADSQFIEETTLQRSGGSCMRMERTGATYGELFQAVQARLERNAWYRLEYWIRTATGTEATGNKLRLRNVTRGEYYDPTTNTWAAGSANAALGSVDDVWRRTVVWFSIPNHWDMDDGIRVMWDPAFTVGAAILIDDVTLWGPYDRKGLYYASAALNWYGLPFSEQAVASEKSEETLSFEVPTFELELDNVNRALRSYLEPVDLLTGGRLRAWLVHLDDDGEPIETGEDPHLDGLLLGEWQIERPTKIDRERFTLPAVGLLDAHRQPVPRRRLAPWCSARFADGVDCLYTTSGAVASGAGSGATSLVLGDSAHYARFAAGEEISIGNGEPVTIVSVNGTTDITLAAPRTWADANAVTHTTCSREFDACTRRLRTHEFLGFRVTRSISRRGGITGAVEEVFFGRRTRFVSKSVADPSEGVPVLIGRRWIEGRIVERRFYLKDDENERAAFIALSEGTCEELWGFSVDGDRADSAWIADQGIIGPYVRVGSIGVDDTETESEYNSDPTTEERAQNRDFRTVSSTTLSRTCYALLIARAGTFDAEEHRLLWDLQGLLLQAYDAAGAVSGSPAWSPSPIWGAIALLTSARYGAGLRVSDIDTALAYAEAAYAGTQIDSTVVNTTVTANQGSPSQTCLVGSTVGMRHGLAITLNGVANTVQRVVSATELRLGTAVAQSIGHVVRGRPQRFEAHLYLDDGEQEAPEAIEKLLSACRGYVTYDRGQVQLRIERDHVADSFAGSNGSLDAWSGGAPTSWTEDETGGTITEETTEVHTVGGSSAELDRTTTGVLSIRRDVTAVPGYWLLTLWVKGEQAIDSALGVRVRNTTKSLNYDAATRTWSTDANLTNMYPVLASWRQTRMLFHLPTSWAGDTIRLTLYHDNESVNASVFFDDVRLVGPLAGWFRDYDFPDESVDTLVSNGGFETWGGGSPTGWTLVQTGGTIVETATARSGSKAVRLDRTGAGDLWALQNFASIPGRTYRLTGWVLAQNATTLAELRVKDNTLNRWLNTSGAWQGGGTQALSIEPLVDRTGAGIWTPFALEFTTEANTAASTMRVQVGLGGSSSGPWCIFDDVALEGPIDRMVCSNPGQGIAENSFEWLAREDDVDINQVVVAFTAEGIQPGRDEAVANDHEHQKRHVLKRKKIDGDAIADLDQAQRIAEYHRRRARQLGPGGRFLAGPTSLLVQPGDVIAVSHDEPGWDLELQRVVSKQVLGLGDPDEGLAVLETEDYDPTIYPDSAQTFAVDPSDSGSSLDLSVQAVPTSVTVADEFRAAADGLVHRHVRLSWTAPAGYVDHYDVRWKPATETEWETAEAPGDATIYFIRDIGTLPSAPSYDIEIRAVNVRGVSSAWVSKVLVPAYGQGDYIGRFDGRPARAIARLGRSIYETFASFTLDTTPNPDTIGAWHVYAGSAPDRLTDATLTGGYGARFAGGSREIVWTDPIPLSPSVRYRIAFRVRYDDVSGMGSASITLGFAAYDSADAFLVEHACAVAAENYSSRSVGEIVLYVGWMEGRATSGSGDTGARTDPDAPGLFHSSAVFIRPLIRVGGLGRVVVVDVVELQEQDPDAMQRVYRVIGRGGRLRSGTRYEQSSGELTPVVRQAQVFYGQDGDTITLPAGYSNPIVEAVLEKGLGPSTSYPIAVCKALNVMSGSFDIYARNEEDGGSPTPDSVAFSGTADADGETVTATKAGDDAEPDDDVHVVQFDVTVPRRQNLGGYPDPDWEAGWVTVEIHARPSGGGAWQGPFHHETFYNDTTSAVVYNNIQRELTLDGLGASAEFKITLVDWFGPSGTSPSLTGDTVTWNVTGAPASQSATPNADHRVRCLVMEGS